MKRRTFDLTVSAGGIGLAVLLVLVGLILIGNARFAETYTSDQLASEGITFKPVDELTDTEKAFTSARTGCLIAHAGRTLPTGQQAECFASEYIAGPLRDPETAHQGMSFAELGGVQFGLQARVAEAEAAGDPRLRALRDELAAVTEARDTVFKGTMLRSSLLTTYGSSVLGDRAAQAAAIVFVAAGVLALGHGLRARVPHSDHEGVRTCRGPPSEAGRRVSRGCLSRGQGLPDRHPRHDDLRQRA